jgi:predicted flap endonuclease-1-like 5' DNA nuclease
MSQNQKNMTEKARESVEKAAYAAVGAPTAALKALSARVSDMRDTVRSSRKEISEDLANEIDEWINEGEAVIERAMERFRKSDLADDIKSSARSTRQAARVGIDKASGVAQSGLDVIAPDEELTVINGIGPSYEAKLDKVGVVGVARFLERTDTEQDLEKLAQSSGISADTLSSWRAQVDLSRIDGIGDSYELVLHRIGIWTMEQLADAKPSEVAEKMGSIEIPDAPDQIPSQSELQSWKREAKKLAPTS